MYYYLVKVCGMCLTFFSLSLKGIGCDAKVAYEFHVTREINPEKFSSQVPVFLSLGFV